MLPRLIRNDGRDTCSDRPFASPLRLTVRRGPDLTHGCGIRRLVLLIRGSIAAMRAWGEGPAHFVFERGRKEGRKFVLYFHTRIGMST